MLNDLRPPITIDEVIVYRNELLRLAWVITQESDNEDFVHDFYLMEKRRNRIARWSGRESMSSWLLTTMRYYRGNIQQAWRNYRPLYDYSRPWDSWCHSDTTSLPLALQEMQSDSLAYLMEDNNLTGLHDNRATAHAIAEVVRRQWRTHGDAAWLSDATCTRGELAWQL